MEQVKVDVSVDEAKRARKEEKRRRREERKNHALPAEVKLPVLTTEARDRVVAVADKIIESLPLPAAEEATVATVVKKQVIPREVRPLDGPEDYRLIVNAQYLKATAEIAALEEYRKALEPYVSDEVFSKRNFKRKGPAAGNSPGGKKRRLNPFNVFWQENKTEGLGLREMATKWRELPAEKKAAFVDKAKRLSDAAATVTLE